MPALRAWLPSSGQNTTDSDGTGETSSSAVQRRTEPDVIHRIHELADLGYSGAAIERLLSADPDYADRLPSLRTVQDIIKDMWNTEEPEWWSVAQATPDEARLVLPVMLYRARYLRKLDPDYNMLPLRLAKGLAHWIAKVRGVAINLTPSEAYKLALRYYINPTPDLDEELARRLEGAGQLADIDGSDGVTEVGVVDSRPG